MNFARPPVRSIYVHVRYNVGCTPRSDGLKNKAPASPIFACHGYIPGKFALLEQGLPPTGCYIVPFMPKTRSAKTRELRILVVVPCCCPLSITTRN